MRIEIKQTKRYDLFVSNERNRAICPQNIDILMDSMKKHGFLHSSPVHVCESNGKLSIIRGHHRVEAAKRLGIPVCYVDDKAVDIVDIESGSMQSWRFYDFYTSRLSSGHPFMTCCEELSNRYGLTKDKKANAAMALLLASNAKGVQAVVKNGTYGVPSRGEIAAADHLLSVWVSLFPLNPRTKQSKFFAAIIIAYKLGVNPDTIKERFDRLAQKLTPFSTTAEAVIALENVYNHGQKQRVKIFEQWKEMFTRERADQLSSVREANKTKLA